MTVGGTTTVEETANSARWFQPNPSDWPASLDSAARLRIAAGGDEYESSPHRGQ